MQRYVEIARQKRTLDELFEYLAALDPQTPAAWAVNAEVKRRELIEIITFQKEALDIQKQTAASQRDAATATQRTAEYTEKNVFYMKWAVIVSAAAVVVSTVALFIHHGA